MSRVRSFLRLPRRTQRVLVSSVFLVTAGRVALRLLPFLTLQRLVDRLARPRPGRGPASQSEIDTIVWALRAAGRTTPTAGRCLVEALAGRVMLGRRGVATDLRIGVARDPDGKFMAHAWLERGDVVVVGQLGPDLARYTPFPALRGVKS